MKIFIITLNRRLLIFMAFLLMFSTTIVLIVKGIHTENIKTFNNSLNEVLEDNYTLKNLLDSLIRQEQKIIFEDENRTVYKNAHYHPPSPIQTCELSKVVNSGVEVNFRILSDDSSYLRPVYDPAWKSTYYRGWLDLPVKNMEARHKIFAFSIGGSMNYDIFGSLGYSPDVSINAHKNINFLIYGFSVKSVKVLENQVALIGETKPTGAQIVSIVQNDLLPEGVDTKDFVFQLSTPKGYEVDFLRYNIIRYEYLMQKIKESTVGAFEPIEEIKSLEHLMQENNSLKEELSYFIPLKDEVIHQQICDINFGSQTKIYNIQSVIMQGKKVPFSYNYSNPLYNRPLYDPAWKVNYKRRWSYIPKQIEYNLHHLLIIPQNSEKQKDFFGALGFREKFQPIKPEQYGLMVYNFNVYDAILYENQLLLFGTPSRTGAQIISVNRNIMNGYDKYLIRILTPDNSEIDCGLLKP